MLELLGLGVLIVGGGAVAAKLGKLDVEKKFTVLGKKIRVGFTPDEPIIFDID